MSIFTNENVQLIRNELNKAKNIVITSHKSPDGDSVGSSLGLYHFLVDLGYQLTICHPDPAPEFLLWIEGTDVIKSWQKDNELAVELIENADLIFCLDYNGSNRVGSDMQPALENSKAFKIMIDHHESPQENFFNLLYSDTTCCSTSQMIAELILTMGEEKRLNAKIGEALYCGIMTDTGSFRFPSTTAETHEIIAKLIRYGVKPNLIHENVYDSNTLDRIQLRGYALSEKMQIWEEYKTAVIYLTEEELKRFNYKKGDTEGLVNVALSIVGVQRAAYFSESEGYVKISFRAKGEGYEINQLAATYFEGGGHKFASGGRHDMPIESAVERFKLALQNENK
jgi:bifunctional oligoribonuclease and PAP phosphatase NrnA